MQKGLILKANSNERRREGDTGMRIHSCGRTSIILLLLPFLAHCREECKGGGIGIGSSIDPRIRSAYASIGAKCSQFRVYDGGGFQFVPWPPDAKHMRGTFGDFEMVESTALPEGILPVLVFGRENAKLHHLPDVPVPFGLDLTLPDVRDDEMRGVRKLENLSYLNLFHTRVTGTGLRELIGLKHLAVLDVSYTAVSDNDVQHLAQLRGLVALDLRATRVTDKALAHLGAYLSFGILI